MAGISELLQKLKNGACYVQGMSDANETTVCSSPSESVTIDTNAISSSSCEDISFNITNTGPAKYLIWGTRGMAGVDPFYPDDKFFGENFADAPTFSVNGSPNGSQFQGFNYRCANLGYLVQSITVRNIPVISGMQSADIFKVTYGCDPENLCQSKKIPPIQSNFNSQNNTFAEVVYNFGAYPVDEAHAVGLLIPAGTDLAPFRCIIDTKIFALASAKNYVPCAANK